MVPRVLRYPAFCLALSVGLLLAAFLVTISLEITSLFVLVCLAVSTLANSVGRRQRLAAGLVLVAAGAGAFELGLVVAFVLACLASGLLVVASRYRVRALGARPLVGDGVRGLAMTAVAFGAHMFGIPGITVMLLGLVLIERWLPFSARSPALWAVGLSFLTALFGIQVVTIVWFLALIVLFQYVDAFHRSRAPATQVRRGGKAGRVVVAVGLLIAMGLLLIPLVRVPHGAMDRSCFVTGDEGQRQAGDGLVIATLGDSSTYGWGVGRRLAYPAVLQGFLRGHEGFGDARVVNCAFPASQPVDLLSQMHRASAFEPRIALVYMGLLGETSDYRKYLPELIEQNRAAGVATVLVSYPTTLLIPPRRQLLEEIADVEDVLHLDLAEWIGEDPWAYRLFIADSVHPNERGHALIGRVIGRALLEKAIARR